MLAFQASGSSRTVQFPRRSSFFSRSYAHQDVQRVGQFIGINPDQAALYCA